MKLIPVGNDYAAYSDDGWIVVQSSGHFGNPIDDFYRGWDEHVQGFGVPSMYLFLPCKKPEAIFGLKKVAQSVKRHVISKAKLFWCNKHKNFRGLSQQLMSRWKYQLSYDH